MQQEHTIARAYFDVFSGWSTARTALSPRHGAGAAPAPRAARDPASERAADVLADSGLDAGYCVALGAASEVLARELVSRSRLHVVVLEPDPIRADALRRRLGRDGLYGRRVAVVAGELLDASLPPYCASLVVCDDAGAFAADRASVEAVYRLLHPYRGAAYLPRGERLALLARGPDAPAWLHDSADDEDLPGLLRVNRTGGPPGAGNWTHEHADAGNSRVSGDTLVKAPLGVLWFGESGNDGMLPRHGHGPQPQVLDGRLFIEGVDKLRCTDVYTGRALWEAPLPGVGAYFNNTSHQAGANGTGTNYVSAPGGVYVALGRSCLRLDPATGKTLATFVLPRELADGPDALWGYLNVEGNYLIGGAASRGKAAAAAAKTQDKPDPDEDPAHKPAPPPPSSLRTVGSRALFVMDRFTGRLLWSAAAEKEFRHNAICAGGGRLYAIDPATVAPRLSAVAASAADPKRSIAGAATGTLRVFDLPTGRPLWSAGDGVAGTWLSYSAEFDVLVEAGRRARDTLRDEPKGMRAYRAASGKVLWADPDAAGPAMIRGNLVLKENSAADLLTGKPLRLPDPITRIPAEWTWVRLYGCNTPAASQNLLTFRAGAASYYDLARFGGTGNFGGFRSGCTNNLVVAGGLLVAPDYTRTCTCSYQMQASLAMVPDASAEEWTYAGVNPDVTDQIRRLGINFGAPGDRADDAGTLWLEYPSVGGKSPKVKVTTASAAGPVEYFRRHASAVEGPMAWVTASGAKNLRSLTIALNGDEDDPRPYTVRLFFAGPAPLKPGECVFDVAIQGQWVEKALDVIAAAGGPDRSLVREFKGVAAGSELKVELKPVKGVPILCGIELVMEGT